MLIVLQSNCKAESLLRDVSFTGHPPILSPLARAIWKRCGGAWSNGKEKGMLTVFFFQRSDSRLWLRVHRTHLANCFLSLPEQFKLKFWRCSDTVDRSIHTGRSGNNQRRCDRPRRASNSLAQECTVSSYSGRGSTSSFSGSPPIVPKSY